MRAEISLREMLVSLALLSLAGATVSGKLQQFVSFNSVEGEIALVVLSATLGLLFFIASIKIKR